MPSTLTDTQKQVLDLVEEGQETALKAINSWTESFGRLLPDLGDLPFSELYARPAEAIDKAFEFSEQLLAAQRQFVRELFAATEPLAEQAQTQAATTTSATRSSSKSSKS